MRVKRPVTFHMAPKKSTKGKEAEIRPTRDEGWLPSKCTESDLESLVKQGFLHSRSVVQWSSKEPSGLIRQSLFKKRMYNSSTTPTLMLRSLKPTSKDGP